MKKKIKLITLIFSLWIFAHGGIAQDDLDEVFDDGDKRSKFSIGTDLTHFISGAPNAQLQARVTKNFSIEGSLGILPFGYHLDGSYILNELTLLDNVDSPGIFFGLAIKRFALLRKKDLQFYYYFDYESWQYEASNSVSVVKDKYSIGLGHERSLIGRLSLDFQIGFYVGRDNTVVNDEYEWKPQETIEIRNLTFSEFDRQYIRNFVFLDLNCGLKYNF